MPPLQFARKHPWDLKPEDAAILQQTLQERVVQSSLPLEQIHRVGGVDVGLRGDKARAAAVILDFPSLQPIEQEIAEVPLVFPYIPGLLSFREAPAILTALEKLTELPDVILFDGQGLAHPRRLGIASHLGVLLDIPTVGCAKSILVGKHATLGERRGSQAALIHHNEIIGMVLRTRDHVRPVIVSIGHRIDLDSAVTLVLACSSGYRLPEPTRLADKLASQKT